MMHTICDRVLDEVKDHRCVMTSGHPGKCPHLGRAERPVEPVDWDRVFTKHISK